MKTVKTTYLAILFVSLACTVLGTGGCGGYYIMTVPDQVSRSGGQVVPVARLQRNDFFILAVEVKKTPLVFRIDKGQERAAYTDNMGYAGVQLDVPHSPGKYNLNVLLQDFEGEVVQQNVPVFVFDPSEPVVAVELDCLPNEGSLYSDEVAAAMRSIARRANIIYLTRRDPSTQAAAHEWFKRAGLPDGPVLLWQRQRWHIVREGRFNLPRIVIESRLDSQLDSLKEVFPNFTTGICQSNLAGKAFREAGLTPIFVGKTPPLEFRNSEMRTDWKDLEARGLGDALSPDGRK